MNDSVVNVLFLLNSLHYGGAEKQTISLINSLDTNKFKVWLACLKEDGSLRGEVNEATLEGFSILNVGKKLDTDAVTSLKNIILEKTIDIVVCVNQYPMLYGILAKMKIKRKLRVIEVFHTTILKKSIKYRLQFFIYRYFFSKCDYLVFVSKNQEKKWIESDKLKAKKTKVITNGIDADHFDYPVNPERRVRLLGEIGFTSSDYLIGICAALREEKKHKDILEAIRLCYHNNIKVKLLIIGDGQEKLSIQKHIESLNLTKEVHITGFKKDVRPYIDLCRCMVISSHSVETFSIAALESMAMGKPMIMTDIGGASEQVVHGSNGFLYEKGDINALARYIELLAEPEVSQKMGSCAKKLVHERFTLEKMTSAYEDLFMEAVQA